MPFGAEPRHDGVRFRLWAPGAQRIELCLTRRNRDKEIVMARQPDGWFEVVTDEARPGSRYRYRIDAGLMVPDPASRYNPLDVHGPSEVIDARSFLWRDADWRGRPWEEAVIYELHVGAFTPAGTFMAAAERLDHLADIGVTAIELMPVADFPGKRNWGYDGVLPYAPDSRYGRPDDLKHLINAAHCSGLMVFLDVVYNHFGPEGNYLHAYAPHFFSNRHHTPWGAAINFDGHGSRTVRDFFIHNALYWLEEFHIDGLRLDAVHAIIDDSDPDMLTELAATVLAGPGSERHIHLVLENDRNAAQYLERDGAGRPRRYTAQWNDDIHHAFHVLATGESDGYYADYAGAPVEHLGRCLSQGFAYQGEASGFRDGARRGEASAHLPPSAFVAFLQNHDQIGNRAFGERLCRLSEPAALRALTAILLLAPSPPLIFMGDEFAATQPFQFFCDFGEDLAAAVTDGRRKEFARFARFSDPAAQATIPDPAQAATFRRSKLAWKDLERHPHSDWLAFYRTLLALRRKLVVPHLVAMPGGLASHQLIGTQGLRVDWILGDGCRLTLVANLCAAPLAGLKCPEGELIYFTEPSTADAFAQSSLPPWSVAWFLDKASEHTSAAEFQSSRVVA
jgi:malto-oligosyltrehalose trehalohydrolase